MKKFLLLILVIFLSNCELKVRDVGAQSAYTDIYSYKEEIHYRMTYGIWYVRDNSSQTGYATSVVNLTKDALEVELLRKQIEIINKKTKK